MVDETGRRELRAGTDDVSLRRRITRRDMLKTVGGGVALAAVAGGTVLDATAASGQVREASTATRTLLEGRAAPRTANIINVAIQTDPLALDPVHYNAHDIERIYRQCCEQLYQWEPTKKIVPMLAASMPKISADGLTYTVKLRKGIKFHNGKTFTSADVKYTYEQVLNPANSSIWLAALGLVTSVAAPDPQTVVIKLSSPYTPLLSSLALIPIVPSNVKYNPNTTYTRSLIGTGPFKFVSWVETQAVTLTKNPHYWNPKLPKSDGIVFTIVPTDGAQISDLVNNSVQHIAEVSALDVTTLRRRGMKVTVEASSSIIDYMYPNVAKGRWTRDVNARLAISWAIDRGRVLKDVFAGIGDPESTLPVAGAEFYDSTIGRFFGSKPNLTKAKHYLKLAGGPPSKPLDFVVFSDDITNPSSEIVADNLKAIGIQTKISQLGELPALGQLFAGTYDLFMLDVLAQESTGFGSYIAYLACYPGAFANFNHFDNAGLAALAKHAVEVTGISAQRKAWRAVQAEWVKLVPQILICSSRYIEASNSHLHGYAPTGLAQLENLKVASVS